MKETSIQLPLRIIPQAISSDNLWAISITNDGGIQLWNLSRMEKTIKSVTIENCPSSNQFR